ncbi:MAG: transglutaminase [Flavobacteriaceae bacterium]|nr:MAG: transglutaminase [Flavobacteriaceae bacterium]
MKKLVFFFALFSIQVFAQNFSRVDSIVKTYPRYRAPQQLAARISSDFSSDIDKVRASFKWITNNIRYSMDYYFHNQRTVRYSYSNEKERQIALQKIRDQIVNKAFTTKTGVCEEYAQSLKKLCDLLDIEAIVLKGYVKNSADEIAKIPKDTNHAWNVVKIQNKWILIDATWAAGYVLNGKWKKAFSNYFFNIPKDKIALTHFPSDKKWQLLLNYSALGDFYNQPIYHQQLLDFNLRLKSPTEGIIAPKHNVIILKLENLLPNIALRYHFKGERYSKKPKITYEGKNATLIIPAPYANTELYLYMNNGIILEYKVVI